MPTESTPPIPHPAAAKDHRWAKALALVTIGCVATAVLIWSDAALLIAKSLVRRETGSGLLNPIVLMMAVGVFAWEWFRPVGGRTVSGPSRLTDLGWWLMNASLAVGGPIIASRLLQRATDQVPAAKESIDILAWLPWAPRFVIAILLVDLVRYVIHVMRHKIPLLWRFHATHHSTLELHQFSAYRMHPIDYGFSIAVAAVPFALFSIPTEGFVAYIVATNVLGRTHHAAVNWHWPIVNRILVSPQIHRIHHSTSPEHYHKNYGLTFSIWDRIFGTFHEPKGDDPTPRTGVPGFQSPEARQYSEVPTVLVSQLLAPLKPMENDIEDRVTENSPLTRGKTESNTAT